MNTQQDREIKQGMQVIGVTEKPTFRLSVTNWGSSPTDPTVVVYKYDESTNEYTDVTDDVFPVGTVSVDGDRIVLPKFVPQAMGDLYRVDMSFTVSGSDLTAFAWVQVER